MKSRRGLYPLRLAVGVALALMSARETAAQEMNEADLSVDIVRGPRSIDEGERARYVVRVENDGPGEALDVNVTASVSSGLELTRVTCRGQPELNNTCVFSSLSDGSTAFVVFELVADDRRGRRSGDEVFRVSVNSDTPDNRRGNDRDRRRIKVDWDDDEDEDDDRRSLDAASREVVSLETSTEAEAELLAAETSVSNPDTERAASGLGPVGSGGGEEPAVDAAAPE